MTPEQVAQYRVDRTGWPSGPWDNEPDRVDFSTQVGLTGLMLRSRLGNWCGYVGVEPGHPAYGKNYFDVPCRVHGGLTYSGECQGNVCHVPAPGSPDTLWWLGFDCRHAYDLAPGDAVWFEGIFIQEGQDYCNQKYVKAQVEKLAAQLNILASPQ